MTKKIYISLFLNFPLSSFFLIIEDLEPNLLFVELFEFLPLKKPEVLFIKVFLLLTSLVLKDAIIFNSSVLLSKIPFIYLFLLSFLFYYV